MLKRLSVVLLVLVLVMALPAGAAAAIRFKRILYNPAGSDTGSNSHLNQEWVLINNTGNRNRDLDGWVLTDRGPDHRYGFTGISLPSGDLLKLHTGSGRHRVTTGCGGDCSVHHYYWGLDDYVWNNDGDRATLKKPNASIADRCLVPGGKKAVRC